MPAYHLAYCHQTVAGGTDAHDMSDRDRFGPGFDRSVPGFNFAAFKDFRAFRARRRRWPSAARRDGHFPLGESYCPFFNADFEAGWNGSAGGTPPSRFRRYRQRVQFQFYPRVSHDRQPDRNWVFRAVSDNAICVKNSVGTITDSTLTLTPWSGPPTTLFFYRSVPTL